MSNKVNFIKNKILNNVEELQSFFIVKTYELMNECFEQQFVNPKVFEALCLLVVVYRNYSIDEEFLENILGFFEFGEDILLDTIQTLFEMYDRDIPDNLSDVIKQLSSLLP